MGNKMMKFQNKRVRERWKVVSVWLGPLYIEPNM